MAWAFWSQKVSNARFLSPKLAPDSDFDRVPESQRASSMEWLKAALRNWGDWNFATEMCSGNAMHWTREQLSRGSLSFVFARSTPVSEYPVSLKTHGVREAKRKINQIPILCNCLVVWSHDKWMCTLVDNRYDTDQLSTGPLLWLVPWKFVWPARGPACFRASMSATNTQIQIHKYNCGGPACFGANMSASSAPTATILSSVAKAIHHHQSKYVHCQYCVIAVVLQCLLWLALVSSVLEHFCLLSFPLSTFRGNYQHLDNQIRQCVYTVHEGREYTWGESKMCPRLQE